MMELYSAKIDVILPNTRTSNVASTLPPIVDEEQFSVAETHLRLLIHEYLVIGKKGRAFENISIRFYSFADVNRQRATLLYDRGTGQIVKTNHTTSITASG